MLALSGGAYAHPNHSPSDPAEPVGDEPPVPAVQGIDPTAKPQQPDAGLTLTDAQLLALANAAAEADVTKAGETITIVDEAPAESASSVHLDGDKLATRSRTQMSDILRQVPGLIVSQHAGGGKADQYFIRGFDADHGTDIAVFADGVPVNLTSHGHGQGYADTHWMIPETIDAVDVHKGPYAARFGDFYTAGALELETIDALPSKGTVYLSGGAPLAGPHGFTALDRRMVALASPELRAHDKTLLAAEIGQQDGAFEHPQDFQRGIAMGKWQGDVGRGRLKLATNWYTARWNQSGQIPVSLVESGMLDRFGAVDPSEGGNAQRASLAAGYELPAGEGGVVRASAYGVRNQLDLFSNFTLWAHDPIHGDEIEQTDARWLYGGDAAYQKSIHREGFDALVTTGVQLRTDDVETSLWHTEQRHRLDVRNHDASTIRDLAAYAEANVIPASWLHVFPGVRVDRFRWDVADLTMATDAMPGPTSTTARTIASPKLSAEVHPTSQINFFANTGVGFHSNDARAAVGSNGHGALARAIAGELGTRVKPSEHSRVSMDIWYLHLSSEQVWSGDEGGTTPSAPTQRFGLDIEGATALTSWLQIDGNVTWAKSRFVANAGNAGAVALAPRWMGSAGATAIRGKSWISLRGRGISDRPGNADGSLVAEGYLVMDLVASTHRGAWGATLTVNNLTNTQWREAQFAEQSRVSPTADVMEQMHFTPGIPLSATAQVSYTY